MPQPTQCLRGAYSNDCGVDAYTVHGRQSDLKSGCVADPEMKTGSVVDPKHLTDGGTQHKFEGIIVEIFLLN